MSWLELLVVHRGVPGPCDVLSHGEITLERPAADLARDRDLILASYLGDTAAATS